MVFDNRRWSNGIGTPSNLEGQAGGLQKVLRNQVRREAPQPAGVFQLNLGGQQRARIAEGEQEVGTREAEKDRFEVVAVGRSFLHPQADGIQRVVEHVGVGFRQQCEQVAPRVGGIKGPAG